MYIYLLLPLISTLIANVFNQISIKFNNNKYQMISLFIIALILCYFAGVRGIKVGTDTLVYGYRSYLTARQSSFNYFFNYSEFASWSPLVKVLVFYSSKVGSNYFFMMFTLELFYVLPVFIGIYLLMKKYKEVSVLLFVLLFYPLSFNLMRQSIAMGFVFLAYCVHFSDLVYRDLIGIGLILVGMLFHSSAIIGSLLILILIFSKAKISPAIGLVILILTLLAMYLIFNYIGLFFIRYFGYDKYLIGSGKREGGGISTFVQLITLSIFFSLTSFIFISYKGINDIKNDNIYKSLSLTVIFGVLVFSLSLINFWFHRISFYFLQFIVLYISYCLTKIKDRSTKVFFFITSLVNLFVFFIVYYYLQNQNQVIPYLFNEWII